MTDSAENQLPPSDSNDEYDPRDEDYRGSSGGAAVAIGFVIIFIAMCLKGAFQ